VHALVIAVSFIAFLGAAKIHGRQLRLEREAAGIHEVTFGGPRKNPPFVEALWAAERWRFWPLAVGLGAAALAIGLGTRRPLALVLVAALLWAPTISFIVTGALSYARRQAARGAPPSA